MAENGEKLYKTKYQGVIDADGHVLEAADLWEKNCEAKVQVPRGSPGAWTTKVTNVLK